MKPTLPGRLHAQRLVSDPFSSAGEVVRHLGAVQSQLHDMALWAVARRTDGLTLADVQSAFDRGDFLRTHVLRPTWHFVDPGDIHWLLALTGPRIERLMASTNASIGLTPTRLDQATEVLVAALADGAPQTRSQIGTVLVDAGLDITGQALAHVMMHAEIEALVVSGPMQDKQHTYALLPPPAVLVPSRDELLARAAQRYGAGHGPFRAKDLAWWTSLTLTDSRRAIQLADLPVTRIDDEDYAVVHPPVDRDAPRAMLLSNYDEYISYARDAHDLADFAGTIQDIMRGSGLLMLDGRLAGQWTRAIRSTAVEIMVKSSRSLDASTKRALQAEVEAYGRFVGRRPVLDLTS